MTYREAQTLISAHEKEAQHFHVTAAEQQVAVSNINTVAHQPASTAVAHIVGVDYGISVGSH